MTPTQRSVAALRADGYHAQVLERWNPYAKVRVDVFGFGDILAFRAGQPGSVLVQTTSGANLAARRTKILGNPFARDWLRAGNWIRLDGWAKRGGRHERKVWTVRKEYLTLDQFTEAP